MRPIFNEKVVKIWYLWVREQCIDALFTVEKSTFATDSKRGPKPHLNSYKKLIEYFFKPIWKKVCPTHDMTIQKKSTHILVTWPT